MEFGKLIDMMVEDAADPQEVYEEFKSAYGVNSRSSGASWAETDMYSAMDAMSENAARYVNAFYVGLETMTRLGIAVPPIKKINKILADNDVPLVIDPPNLLLKEGDIELVEDDASEEAKGTSFVKGPVIGRGGFGVVYQITRKTKIGDYHYAMKVLEPSSFVENKDRARKRFEREMNILGQLQHRGIVTMLEAGIGADEKPYILMPYVDGDDLRTALSGAGPTKVCRIFNEILVALEFAHNKGVIHRDLKPKNILVRKADEHPLILDFGCAYLLDEVDDNLTTTLIGSSPYIPMEVHLNPKHRDIRQDVYACGVMLYEVIGECLPKPDDYEPLELEREEWTGIDAVIQAALAPERKRFTSAKAFRVKLEELCC